MELAKLDILMSTLYIVKKTNCFCATCCLFGLIDLAELFAVQHTFI